MNRGQIRMRRGSTRGGSSTFTLMPRNTQRNEVRNEDNQIYQNNRGGGQNNNRQQNQRQYPTNRGNQHNNNREGYQNYGNPQNYYQHNRGNYNGGGGWRGNTSRQGEESVRQWSTPESRERYTEKLGLVNTAQSSNSSARYDPKLQTNSNNAMAKPSSSWQQNSYQTRGNRKDFKRKTPQELKPSELQISNAGRAGINLTKAPVRPVRSGTEDRLGQGAKPGNINAARDLMQEEYEIQAAEYAAKSREREIKKLQEKMMRLRFCSTFDEGNRLGSQERDLSPGRREKMVQKLQAEYNEHAKVHAIHMKQIEAKKEEVRKAKKLEKLERDPAARSVMASIGCTLGSASMMPCESSGAIPKRKFSTSNETSSKRQPTYARQDSSTRKSPSPASSYSLSEMPSKRQPTYARHSDSSSKSASSSSCDSPSDNFSINDINLSEVKMKMQTKLNKEAEINRMKTVLAEYSPASEDFSLRTARLKMQEKLDREIQMKKEEEERKRSAAKAVDVAVGTEQCVPQEKQKDVITNLPKAELSTILKVKQMQTVDFLGQQSKDQSVPEQTKPSLVLRAPQKQAANNSAGSSRQESKVDIMTLFDRVVDIMQKKENKEKKNLPEDNRINENASTSSVKQTKNKQKKENTEKVSEDEKMNENLSTSSAKQSKNEQKKQNTKNKKASAENRINENASNSSVKQSKDEQNEDAAASKTQVIEDTKAVDKEKLKQRLLKLKEAKGEKIIEAPANSDPRSLSILEQLRIRASKMDQEYEEQYAHILQASSSKPDVKNTAPVSEQTECDTNGDVHVPLIWDADQINEYDRTGIVPEITEFVTKGRRLFTTKGLDYQGLPILRLRTC